MKQNYFIKFNIENLIIKRERKGIIHDLWWSILSASDTVDHCDIIIFSCMKHLQIYFTWFIM